MNISRYGVMFGTQEVKEFLTITDKYRFLMGMRKDSYPDVQQPMADAGIEPLDQVRFLGDQGRSVEISPVSYALQSDAYNVLKAFKVPAEALTHPNVLEGLATLKRKAESMVALFQKAYLTIKGANDLLRAPIANFQETYGLALSAIQ